MAAVPVRNLRIEAAEQGEGVALTMPLVYSLWMRPFVALMRLPPRRTYQLDGIGLSVWRRIDGRASIGDVVESFASEHLISYHESRAMLMHYFQLLLQRGIIVIVGMEAPHSGEDLAV